MYISLNFYLNTDIVVRKVATGILTLEKPYDIVTLDNFKATYLVTSNGNNYAYGTWVVGQAYQSVFPIALVGGSNFIVSTEMHSSLEHSIKIEYTNSNAANIYYNVYAFN